MKLPISPRLLSCAGFVRPGERVADIGCDHGYLGIYLLTQGIASQVLSADINKAPLDCAYRNAQKFGVDDRMRFYLSDGVRNVPRDFDVLVCAGMGGDTIQTILEAAPWLKDSRYRLILQCQSKTPQLRQYLSKNGWVISQEPVLQDGRFLYTQMEVLYRPQASALTPGQCFLPPVLVRQDTADSRRYCRRVYAEIQKILSARGENADPFLVQAARELQEYDCCKEENL